MAKALFRSVRSTNGRRHTWRLYGHSRVLLEQETAQQVWDHKSVRLRGGLVESGFRVLWARFRSSDDAQKPSEDLLPGCSHWGRDEQMGEQTLPGSRSHWKWSEYFSKPFNVFSHENAVSDFYTWSKRIAWRLMSDGCGDCYVAWAADNKDWYTVNYQSYDVHCYAKGQSFSWW